MATMFMFLRDCLASINLQTWLIFIIIFMLAYNYLTKQQWKNLPPGPPALPLVGSMPFLGADIRAPLLKMAKKYGNVFSIYMGSTRVVVLSGYEAIRDAFAKSGHAFSGRPPLFFVEHITMGYGIVSSQGAFWQEQRRHTMHVLRNFGVGRTIIEDRILEEVGFFIKALREQTGRAYNPHPLIQASVANVIAAVTFGKRYDYDDPLFKKYMKNTTDSFEVLGNSGVLTVFPFLRHIPGDLIGYKKLMVMVNFMNSEYQRMIDEHQASFDVTKEPTDVIDAYLKTMEDVKDDPDTTFTGKQLQHLIGDLFGAGTETSATTLAWSLVYMTLNPDIQSKVQAEIDEVIGKDDLPSMSHRTKMPYTEACLAEIQRLGDIVPLGVPHSTTEDITFRGFFIPSGTMILPNMNSIHMDPDLWEEPERFDPGRFLDDDGHFVKREELIPFSIGKRVCLGEGLARMELFLYFVSMMQNFEFRVHPDHLPPATHGILSITNIPKPYKILVTERK